VRRPVSSATTTTTANQATTPMITPVRPASSHFLKTSFEASKVDISAAILPFSKT
jgi:hypothetical protein